MDVLRQGWSFLSSSPHLSWDFVWLELMWYSCMLSSLLWIHMSNLFHQLFWTSLWSQKFEIGAQFRDNHSAASCSLYICQLWVSVLITICCIKKPLCWEFRDALIYGCNLVIRSNCNLFSIVIRLSPMACGLSSHIFIGLIPMSGIDSILWSKP